MPPKFIPHKYGTTDPSQFGGDPNDLPELPPIEPLPRAKASDPQPSTDGCIGILALPVVMAIMFLLTAIAVM